MYLVILAWTFLEGETVVLITGALISGGNVHLSVWTLALVAFAGSFGGDQAWFYIGRKYGTPLLARWPNMGKRVEWAFRLLRKEETVFILTFRFIYGLRNISPFVIGMAGVSRIKFLALNCVAAAIWANTFAWGGFSVGKVLETYLGQSSQLILGLFILVVVVSTVASKIRQRMRTHPLPPDKVTDAEEKALTGD